MIVRAMEWRDGQVKRPVSFNAGHILTTFAGVDTIPGDVVDITGVVLSDGSDMLVACSQEIFDKAWARALATKELTEIE